MAGLSVASYMSHLDEIWICETPNSMRGGPFARRISCMVPCTALFCVTVASTCWLEGTMPRGGDAEG